MNDYEARLERLSTAERGDTVTVPAGWELPVPVPAIVARGAALSRIRPGMTFTHDGSSDELPWHAAGYGFEYTMTLAGIGLDVDVVDPAVVPVDAEGDETADEHINDEWDTTDVDTADSDEDEQVAVSDAAPDGDDDEESGPTPIGSVTVRVIPDTDGFIEKIAKVAGEAADAIDAAGFHLDEYQRERVAALEQAVRILESRRAPSTSGAKTFGDMFVRSGVPIVGVQDMVDVAAFIAEGDTGRAEVDA